MPTLAVTLCELCMPEAFCGLELCAKKLRELCALCERKASPATLKRSFPRGGYVLFLTEHTDEQNTQGFTETLSQPISQSITANLS